MQFPSRLLALPLLIGCPEHALLNAQAQPAHAPTRTTADSITVTVRWNRLVPKFVDEAAAGRRAAKTVAAGDSAALRRIAQAPPPLLFRIFTLLSVAQYAAVNSARDNRDASSNVAVASASAAVLTELFSDAKVRASIARELAQDIEQSPTGLHAAERT